MNGEAYISKVSSRLLRLFKPPNLVVAFIDNTIVERISLK